MKVPTQFFIFFVNFVVNAEALFGDASDISDEEDGKKKKDETEPIASDKEDKEDKRSEAGSDRPASADEAEEVIHFHTSGCIPELFLF